MELQPGAFEIESWEPSFVLTIGTGRSMSQEIEDRSGYSWIHCCIHRLRRRLIGRSFSVARRYTSGHRFWTEFASQNPSLIRDKRVWRFDPFKLPNLSGLANTEAIPALIELTNTSFSQWPDKGNITRALISNMFSFSLIDIPTYAHGRVMVRGRVASTWPPPIPGADEDLEKFEVWSRRVDCEQLQVFVAGQYVGTIRPDHRGHCQCPVTLELTGLSELFTIKLRAGIHEPSSINGSPYRVEELMQHQGMPLGFLPIEGNFNTRYSDRRERPGSKRIRLR